MTQLGDALTELFSTLAAEAGGTIEVTRGLNPAVTLQFIRGRAVTRRLASPEDALYVSAHLDDFIVQSTDYISQVGTAPIEGDKIEWVDDNLNTRQFQLILDGAERAYDPVGQFGLLYRLHAVEIT